MNRYRSLIITLAVFGFILWVAGPARAEDYRDTVHSEVNFSPASSQAYVGSPSIVVLPNGDYLATHALFGPGSNGQSTLVFRSRNSGVTWEPVKDSPVQPMMWATIFINKGDVYLMGSASDSYGDAVISRSTDNGATWSEPVSLLQGAYHTGDTPMLVREGRIYKTFEENLKPPGWAPNFRPLMISADVDADLTNPESWTRTNNVDKGSVLEGNPIVGPDGMIWNILRNNGERDEAWVTKLDPSDPATLVSAGPISFPYGVSYSKFFLLWDQPSQRYLLVGNPETSSTGALTQRNRLDLYESKNLTSWKHVRTLVEDDDITNWSKSVRQSAFSQPTAQIDGDDLVVVSRTAYEGAASYHDANRMTFHRYSDFRQYLDADGELAHYSFDASRRPAADVSKAADTDANLTETTKLVPGRVGHAIEITGTDNYVDLGNRIHPLLDGRRAVTVSAWIKADSLPSGEGGAIFGSRINGGGAGVDLLFNGANIQVGGRSVSGDAYQVKKFPFSNLNTWVHLTAMWDFKGDDMLLYIDGEPQAGTGDVDFASDTYEIGSPSQPDRIGGLPNGTIAFDGSIDEVRIFSSAIDGRGVKRLVGRGNQPALDTLTVNGAEIEGFNPNVEHYDIVLPEAQGAVVAADPAPGSKITNPRRTVELTDVASTPIEFEVRQARQSKTYTLTVRNESSDTALAGVRAASGDRASYAPSDTDYKISVEEKASEPLDLTLTEVIPLRIWAGATAEVVEQPDPTDRNPVGVVRVRAEDGTTAEYDVRFDVDRQLVSATAEPQEGNAPLAVNFTANPTEWVQGEATYQWNFGDGTNDTGEKTEHVYQSAGRFVASVTVTDESGETDTAEAAVRVRSADRLIGHWKFEETANDIVRDSSLYGKDGTSAAARRVTGHDGSGTALEFSNSGGITLDDELGVDLDDASAITISGWIKPDSSPPSGQIGNWIFGTRISGGAAGAEIYMLGETLRVGGRSQVGDPYVRSDYEFSGTGEWHHIAAVLNYADNDIQLYIDGTKQASVADAGSFASRTYQYASASQPDSIGRNPDGAYRFAGTLDDIQVHARALTSTEIASQADHG